MTTTVETALVALLPDAVLLVDLDGTTRQAAGGVVRLLGGPAEDLLGVPFARLVAPRDRMRWSQAWEALTAGAVDAQLDHRVVLADGSETLVETRVEAVRSDAAVAGYLCVLRDLTGVLTGPTAGIRREQALHARVVLTARELEVLRLLTAGQDPQQISTALAISIHTTRAYLKSAMRKLEARTQLQAVLSAARLGLLDLD